ncbi:MAG: beta-lactamase family protein [Saprospiraceae bacterium]|nr:beta-lactamase family protein [Saprospiraceae bacterium]
MKNFRYLFIGIVTYIFISGCTSDGIDKTSDCTGSSPTIHPKSAIYQSVIDKYTKAGLPGIAILVRDKNGLWIGASGKADIEQNIPMKPCVISKGASTTKTFIGTLTLLLAEEGKLSLDDKIEKWLPQKVIEDVKNAKSSTVRMLLNHTSGIADIIDDQGFYLAVLNNPSHNWTSEELIKYVFDDEPIFPAGTDVEYSNTNYLLLAMILDKVTGKNHSITLREKILNPLKLSNSYYFWHDPVPANTAQGYFDFYNNGTILNLTNYNTGSGNGYGGLYTTVYDLQIFIEALVKDKKVLKQQSLDQMLTFTKEDESYSRANGLGIFKDFLERAPNQFGYGHRGRDLGYTADMYWFPNQNITMTYLINYGTDAKSELREVFLAFRKEIVDKIME